MKKAFTLTELLIALAVLGLLIAVLTPIISNLIPDQNALMAKRSYYAAQTLISELINDEACYPDMTQADDARVGFDDGYGYQDCMAWGGTEATKSMIDQGNTVAAAGSKLVTLFKNKLDIKSEGDSGQFETRDGTFWHINSSNLAINNKDSYLTITVDVNGNENPNCAQSNQASSVLAVGGDSCASRTDGFDIYSIKVYADGRMEINDDWAKAAVDINKDVTSTDDDEDEEETTNP